MNEKFFDYKRIAEGYLKDRPWLHGQVMERAKIKFGLEDALENGLDIGCGAGLSTKALRLLCKNVLGTDISQEMILAAQSFYQEPGYSFQACKAEELKAEPKSFDIVTAAGVMNWVDETVFLPLLFKMLKPQGIFLIYDFWISDRMKGNAAYTEWFHDQYLRMFPKPKRKEEKWTEEMVAPYDFHILEQEEYEMDCPMSLEQFIRFMLLQSNVVAQVEEKHKDLNAVKHWFEETLTPIWHQKTEVLCFDGYSWYIGRRISKHE